MSAGRRVLLESDMPRNTGDCRYRAELVDNIARNEVDVVVSQFEISIADALAT